ncbi:hypothetical protein BU23DRAFT_579832 [Bimuria novae-zelandiae CBS 107.79]|uniref:Ferric reductase NAD binding domain-containing protein n=1 Tax=Bimuria novae-zelandiae CBS 107.79 TaxID=1447943 RepID=A0A6A5VB90_9PLEO|nr:hypothetical protein BU23DRAFT_579832 [Bimuria novae-zelandiae CBS 107.79]
MELGRCLDAGSLCCSEYILFFLALFHTVVILVSQPSFALNRAQNLFAVIAAPFFSFLPLFRRLAYEPFLRTHQAFALLSAYAIWRHLPSTETFPRCYVYILASLFLFMCVVQVGSIIYQNGFFRCRLARAEITHEYGAIQAEQYINLWMPSVSLSSVLQSHPFVPRNGPVTNALVVFSGPHGRSIPMEDCENILMVASGFGIAAHLPYLKQLIHGYNAREVRARRIYLVWQVRDIDVTIAAQSLLNDVLDEDTLDDGWILAISIYCESSNIRSKSFGRRAKVYPGKAPLRDIVQAEVRGDHIERKLAGNVHPEPGQPAQRDGKLLITVSGTDHIREQLRGAVREHLTDDVVFSELDYQPS